MFAIYYFLNCFGTCRRRSSPASNKFRSSNDGSYFWTKLCLGRTVWSVL